MKTFTLLVTLASVLMPGAVLAMGCPHESAAITCAEGTKWNPETRICETMSS